MPGEAPIKSRKEEHLRIVLEEDVRHRGSTLLECVELLHNALPELALHQIDTTITFFGKQLAAPLMITGMTGGAEYAGELNRALARAAAESGIALGLGSQRILFKHPEALPDFAVRELIPDGVLLANLGAAQLREYPPSAVSELIAMVEADGICLHLNPAQELAQVEGDRDFRGLAHAIGALAEYLPGRVLVKETGAGMSPGVLRLLASLGVRYIDVAGAGGTSWAKVESLRRDMDGPEAEEARRLGRTFADWGIPTAVSTIAARRICPEGTCIIASGGITTGLDAARALACGADLAGFARSALLAYDTGGTTGVSTYIQNCIAELRGALLLCGAQDLNGLKTAPKAYTYRLRQWIKALGLPGSEVTDE